MRCCFTFSFSFAQVPTPWRRWPCSPGHITPFWRRTRPPKSGCSSTLGPTLGTCHSMQVCSHIKRILLNFSVIRKLSGTPRTGVRPVADWSPCVIPNGTHEPRPAPPTPACKAKRTGNLAIRSARLPPPPPLARDIALHTPFLRHAHHDLHK